jgi:glycosyltransferase involved in cell wall biosynthesis
MQQHKARASGNTPNIHLLIAGDGELADEVRSEIAQLDLSQQVTLLGALNQGELAKLHQVGSAFILSSAYEGLPLVVLEALACGTPVVTTRCGETPNLLSPQSGVVCAERTTTSIADALLQVLQHPEDYPSKACVQTAQPYAARTVVHEVYTGMLQRWQQQVFSAVSTVH